MSEHLRRERVGMALFYAAVLLLGWLLYRIFQPFLAPLAWAGVLVVVLLPWHERLEGRFRRTTAAALSTAGVTLILVVPALLLLGTFINEGVDAARSIQQAFERGEIGWINRAREWIQQRAPAGSRVDPGGLAREAAERVGTFFAMRAGGVLRDVLMFFVDLFLMLFALFFLFRDRVAIVEGIRSVLPFEPAQRDAMIRQARDLIQASVTCSLVVAVLQGLLGGVTFALLGLPNPVFWGVVMVFVALIPVVGTALVWAPAAVWLLFGGHPWKAVILAGVGMGVIGMVDNLLRPILVGERAQMNTLVMLISVLGGMSVFGMLGLVLGPIVVATATSLLSVYAPSQLPGSTGAGGTKPGEAGEAGREAVLELPVSEAGLGKK